MVFWSGSKNLRDPWRLFLELLWGKCGHGRLIQCVSAWWPSISLQHQNRIWRYWIWHIMQKRSTVFKPQLPQDVSWHSEYMKNERIFLKRRHDWIHRRIKKWLIFNYTYRNVCMTTQCWQTAGVFPLAHCANPFCSDCYYTYLSRLVPLPLDSRILEHR